jgi:hypothetical protein
VLAVVALWASRRDRLQDSPSGCHPLPAGEAREALARGRLAPNDAKRRANTNARRPHTPSLRTQGGGAPRRRQRLRPTPGGHHAGVRHQPIACRRRAHQRQCSPFLLPRSPRCSDSPTLALSGTLGASGSTANAVIYILVKPAPSSTSTVAAETSPAESGDRSVEGVPLPASTEAKVDVRAVVERDRDPRVMGRRITLARSEILPGSRIVQLTTTEAPAVARDSSAGSAPR